MDPTAPTPTPGPTPAPTLGRAGASPRTGTDMVAAVPVWASTRDWVPRVVAARTRDLAVVTRDNLCLFSIGFFTRRARRRVYDVPLARLTVTEMPTRRGRRLQVESAVHRPLLLDIGTKPAANAFADDLLRRVASTDERAAPPDGPTSEGGSAPT